MPVRLDTDAACSPYHLYLCNGRIIWAKSDYADLDIGIQGASTVGYEVRDG